MSMMMMMISHNVTIHVSRIAPDYVRDTQLFRCPGSDKSSQAGPAFNAGVKSSMREIRRLSRGVGC